MPRRRSSLGRATTAPRWAHLEEPAGVELADRLAHGRARHAEAARELGLVERGTRRNEASHDVVGEREAQLLGQGAAALGGGRRGLGRGLGGRRREAVGERHRGASASLGSSIRLT